MTFILLLWSVEAFEHALALDFRELGILPRTLRGSIGIITAPLVHGDVFHLLSNTFPLIILGIGMFYFYNKIALDVILVIYFMTGFWVWVVAREAYHIGASGIVYGLLSFIFFSGVLRKDARTLAVSLVLLFVYGGNMIYGVFPINSGISWESHLLGAITGLGCALFYRRVKSSVVEKDPFFPMPEEEEVADVESQRYQYTLRESSSKKEKNAGYEYKVNKDDLV